MVLEPEVQFLPEFTKKEEERMVRIQIFILVSRRIYAKSETGKYQILISFYACNARCLCRSNSTVHTACIDYVRNWDSVSRVFVLGKSRPPRAFPLLEDSEFLMMLLSLIVILRSCIASLEVLNYDLKDHLK